MRTAFLCRRCRTAIETEASKAGETVVCDVCSEMNTVPSPHIARGLVVGGFRIVRLLGQGGMGEVYLARQLSMDRDVALKILPSHWTASRTLVSRFLSEVHAAARLDHPYIVPAYEAGEDMGLYYMAMAYVDGETVETRLQRDGPLPEADALVVAGKVAQALEYAWKEARLLHRDIKPSNIMIDRRGEVRLMDLGISRSLYDRPDAPRTRAGVPVGTPNYMSPEQAEGHRDLDHRSDMYSLGATLYQMLTGSVPYGGDNLLDTLRRQAHWRLPHPATLRPGLSTSCVRLLEILLARDRDDRPASWGSLVRDIDRAWRGLPPASRPPERAPFLPVRDGTPRRTGARRRDTATAAGGRRWPVIVLLLATALVLLALDAWLLYRLFGR